MNTAADIADLTFFELQEQPSDVKASAVRSGLARSHDCDTCCGFGYVKTTEWYEDDIGELVPYGVGDSQTCGHCYGEGVILLRPCDLEARADVEQAEQPHDDADLDWMMF